MRRKKKLVVLCLAVVGGLAVLAVSRLTPVDQFSVGWEALQRGDWREVSRQIDALRRDRRKQNEVRLLRGSFLLRTGNPHAALNELTRIPANDIHREQVLLLTCEAYYSLHRWIDAAATANELLQSRPDHPDAHRWLGAIYYDLGANDEAEIHLKKLAQLKPKDYSPYRLLGLIHKDFSRFKEAIADYQSALERHPPDQVRLQIGRELAQSQIQQTDYVGALKTLDSIDGNQDLELKMLRAECLWTLGRKEEAVELVRIAQQTDGESLPVLRLAARFATDEGRADDAVRFLETVTKIDPFDHRCLFDLSLAYRRVNRLEEADRVLERRHVVFALMERLSELNTKAIREPSNPTVREELADGCEQLGKKELAAVWRQAARSIRDGGAVPQKTPN